LAQLLGTLGVGPNVCVGVCMERSLDVIVALLGILKAGGAFLPLDPSYPASRLTFMLQNSGAGVLLVHADTMSAVQVLLQERLQHLRALVCLDHSPEPANLAPDLHFFDATTMLADVVAAPRLDPQHLAYLMYTSGSTGQPKGVPIPHSNAVAFFTWYQQYFGLRSDDHIIQYHSLSFDFSTWEIFEALLVGACLHMVPATVARDAGALTEELVRAHITVLNMTPSQFSALADDVEHIHPRALAALRILVLGGELLPSALAQRAARLSGSTCQIYNEYGPTETTISSAILPITSAALRQHASRPAMPIGRPIGNTQIYLLDARLEPVPIAVSGELYIAGIGLTPGYHNHPELTAERFVPNPFPDFGLPILDFGLDLIQNRVPRRGESKIQNGTRLYKTGDLACYLPDGTLNVLGRRDRQVKLRGYRIELGEIEASLRQHPAVREAVVLAREYAPHDTRLVAYVVPTNEDDGRLTIDDGRPSELSSIVNRPSSMIDELRDFLKERLPDYMVPSAFVTLDALPLTPSGKLDHRALPAPDGTSSEQQAGFVAPRTPTEATLAQIWAEVLGLEQVGVHDDFFGLGGHSLSATRAIVRANQTLDVSLSVRILFLQPTVEKLATMIDNARAVSASDEAVAQRIADLKARIAHLNAQANANGG
jgi:amino acid adenylation domain-containing protein